MGRHHHYFQRCDACDCCCEATTTKPSPPQRSVATLNTICLSEATHPCDDRSCHQPGYYNEGEVVRHGAQQKGPFKVEQQRKRRARKRTKQPGHQPNTVSEDADAPQSPTSYESHKISMDDPTRREMVLKSAMGNLQQLGVTITMLPPSGYAPTTQHALATINPGTVSERIRQELIYSEKMWVKLFELYGVELTIELEAPVAHQTRHPTTATGTESVTAEARKPPRDSQEPPSDDAKATSGTRERVEAKPTTKVLTPHTATEPMSRRTPPLAPPAVLQEPPSDDAAELSSETCGPHRETELTVTTVRERVQLQAPRASTETSPPQQALPAPTPITISQPTLPVSTSTSQAPSASETTTESTSRRTPPLTPPAVLQEPPSDDAAEPSSETCGPHRETELTTTTVRDHVQFQAPSASTPSPQPATAVKPDPLASPMLSPSPIHPPQPGNPSSAIRPTHRQSSPTRQQTARQRPSHPDNGARQRPMPRFLSTPV